MIRRIIYKADNKVSVIILAPKAIRRWRETDGEGQEIGPELNNIQALLDKATPEGVEYDDVEESTLPQERSKRYAWRGSKGNGVHIDNSVPKPVDKRKNAKDKLVSAGILNQDEADAL